MRRVAVLLLLSACSLFVSLDDLGGSDAGDASSPNDTSADGCGDTTSSPENCGVCGHSCLGGECKASVCQPVALAAAQSMPDFLRIDGAELYWIASNQYRRGPTELDAGDASNVGSSPNKTQPLQYLNAVAPTLYAISNGSNLSSIAENEPADGSVPTIQAFNTSTSNVTSLAYDGTYYFVYTQSSTCSNGLACILAVPTPAQNSKRIADKLGAGGQLAVGTGNRVFYFSNSDVGTVAYGNTTGLGTTLATLGAPPTSIAIDATNVYVTIGTLGSVMAIPQAGLADGGAPVSLASNLATPRFAATGAGLLAWYTNDGLMACDPASCDATRKTYAPSLQYAVSSIAIDAKAIYWTDPTRAGVYKVAR